jgi:hypothetical protein
VDGKIDEPLLKLTRALKLPEKPIGKEPASELLVKSVDPQEPDHKNEATATPTFAMGDLFDLFTSATEIADRDPEQAVFLYHRVIEINPNYMQGKEFCRARREKIKARACKKDA